MKLSYKGACRIWMVFNSVMATGLLVSAPALTKGFFNPPERVTPVATPIRQYTLAEQQANMETANRSFLFAGQVINSYHRRRNSFSENAWLNVRTDLYKQCTPEFRATHTIQSL